MNGALLSIDQPTPTAPPGSEEFLKVLSWGSWGVSIACIAGVLIVAATMAVKHHRGEGGGEHLGKLGWVLLATVLGATAGPLVTALGA